MFPTPVGLFYTKNGNPIKVGHNGQADINGWVNIIGLPIRLEIEVKSGKKGIIKDSDQFIWKKICDSDGVIHIEGRSPEQVIQELNDRINLIEKTYQRKG